jgi:mono/diheme cytochrome c family protein
VAAYLLTGFVLRLVMNKMIHAVLVAVILCSCLMLGGCGDGNSSSVTGSGATMGGTGQQVVLKRPDTPAEIIASGGINKVTLSWNAVNGAESYNIYWSSAPGVSPETGHKITGATSPFQHDNLFVSQTYFYVVTAVNRDGESVASQQVSTVSANDGANLYAIYCASCHGDLPVTTIVGGTPEKITAAIAANTGGMGTLTTLVKSQIDIIAAKLPCH